MESPERSSPTNFIRAIIDEDLKTGKNGDAVVTRFPPEPNGYLHIGHAKAICLNFGIARDYTGGKCHLRFDDTNPISEDPEYVESIQRDIKWLGFDWSPNLFFASDYFEQLYEMAEDLIKQGKAFVDSESSEEIRLHRGTITEPGVPSTYRNRTVEENLDLFRRMREGEFEDGAHVLRAKIDMTSPNMLLRDPVMYRIKHAHHYRRGDDWVIYPLYDYAHPLSDAIEGITHSLCSLEFEVHRPLYNWFVENVSRQWPIRPRQYEFARLNLDYTVMSKRKLRRLVENGLIRGWDDPRMLTISGLRRRGYTPESIQDFCERVGVAKAENRVEVALLEYSIRNDLNHKAPRVMCVLDPLKVVITNYPEEQVEEMDASYWPHDVPKEGSRPVPFSREIFIDRDDFQENPHKKFFRLAPGREVRLRYAYIIKCEDVVKDNDGNIVELHCTYDPDTKSGTTSDGRKIKGTIHWVSAQHALPVEVRIYDRLFKTPDPELVPEGQDFLINFNQESEIILKNSLIEPSVAGSPAGTRFQFERQGYFVTDEKDSQPDALVFNRTVTLRDTWAKIADQAPSKHENKRKKSKGQPAQAKQPERSRESILEALTADSKSAGEAFAHYVDSVGLSLSDAEVLATDTRAAKFVDETHNAGAPIKVAASWIVNILPGELKDKSIESIPFDGAQLAELIGFVEDGTISNRTGKQVLAEMIASGSSASTIIDQKGLKQVSDSEALSQIVNEVLSANPSKVDEFKSGKTRLIGFFVGEAMKASKGAANPKMVKDLLTEKLAS